MAHRDEKKAISPDLDKKMSSSEKLDEALISLKALAQLVNSLSVKVDRLANIQDKGARASAAKSDKSRKGGGVRDKKEGGAAGAVNVMEYFKQEYVKNPKKFSKLIGSTSKVEEEVRAQKSGKPQSEIERAIANKIWSSLTKEVKEKIKNQRAEDTPKASGRVGGEDVDELEQDGPADLDDQDPDDQPERDLDSD